MTLIRAVDAAYPPAISALDPSVKVVLGYVGQQGHTPHIWTAAEIASVRASGRQWWPIWVPAQGAMSAATGAAAAQGMIAALAGYGVSKTTPVMLDIETGAWDASPAGAQAAIDAFKAGMQAAAYTRPFAYVPHKAGLDWIANWTGTAPTALPVGVIGQQYASNTQVGDGWDHSVFDAALLDAPTPPAPPVTPAQPKPQSEESDMRIVHKQSPDLYLLIGACGQPVLLTHQPSADNLVKSGIPSVVIDDDTYNVLRANALRAVQQ